MALYISIYANIRYPWMAGLHLDDKAIPVSLFMWQGVYFCTRDRCEKPGDNKYGEKVFLLSVILFVLELINLLIWPPSSRDENLQHQWMKSLKSVESILNG